MIVITLGAWYYWSTGRQARTAALVFALSSVGSLMTIDTFGFPLVFTSLIVLVLSWGCGPEWEWPSSSPVLWRRCCTRVTAAKQMD